MSTLLWLTGFGLVLASFTFLLARAPEAPTHPRISVESWLTTTRDRRSR